MAPDDVCAVPCQSLSPLLSCRGAALCLCRYAGSGVMAEECTHLPASQRTLVTANDQNCPICPALITPLSPN